MNSKEGFQKKEFRYNPEQEEGWTPRKSHRVVLPARVVIQGKTFEVFDWSIDGFGIEHFPGVGEWQHCRVGEKVAVTFIFRFESFETTFDATAELRWARWKRAGFLFCNLPARARNVIRAYVEESLKGFLSRYGEVIKTSSDEKLPRFEEAPAAQEYRETLKNRFRLYSLEFRRHSFLYSGIAAALLFALLFIFHQPRYIDAVGAVVKGNRIDVESVSAGIIQEVHVREGETVREGQVLLELANAEQVAEFEKARVVFEKRREAVSNLQEVLERERGKAAFYYESVKSQEALAARRLEIVDSQLKRANEIRGQTQKLFDDYFIGPAEFIEEESKYFRLHTTRTKAQEELLLARQNLIEAEKERSFSEGKLAEKLKEIQKELAQKESEVRQAKLRYQRALEQLEKTRAVASRAGVLNKVYCSEGDYVKSGEIVATIETISGPWVLARLKLDEAKLIRHNDPAEVYFPEPGLTVSGRVQAVGEAAVRDRRPVSQTRGVSPEEVPVKVVLDEVPEALKSGQRAEVKIRARFRIPFLSVFGYVFEGNWDVLWSTDNGNRMNG